MDTSLLNGLNAEQLAAVTWPPAAALVLAGAGSGKTRVLTTRIAWLLDTEQASVHSIMAVTFTNKAAKEMQHRLSSMLPYSTRAMWLGTFHGLCHRFLRTHYQDARLPSTFQILDSGDQASVIKRLLKSLNIAEESLAPKTLQYFINSNKEAGLRASDLNAHDKTTRQLIECYQAYDALCQQEGMVDFAELMLRSYEVLLHNAAIRTHYQQRFNHILVDEFQDTNILQYKWLKLLAGDAAAVFAVGDDDQSIYAFRGANVGNMQTLMQDFGIREPLKLEINYRSVGNILTAANTLIANNSGRLGKNLRLPESKQGEQGQKLRLYVADSDFLEADFVVSETKERMKEGVALDNMAVLYRSNAQSRVLEQALFAASVPYKIYGGLRFYERQEIKHALAYLRLAVQPQDDQSVLRVINMPPRGIGARTIEAVQAVAHDRQSSLWDALQFLITEPANRKLKAFVDLIEQLQAQVKTVELAESVQAALDLSGLIEYYKTQKGDHQDRIDNLQELVSAAMVFNSADVQIEEWVKTDDGLWPLVAFLSNASLEAGERQAGEGEAALQLMTIHAAKGLEFNTVFLTGLEEGLFPSEYSLQEKGGLEEERRLMYVAITRARERLYLSAAQQRLLHGRTNYSMSSRFIEELPDEVLQFLSSHRKKTQDALKIRQEPLITAKRAKETFDGFVIGQNVRHDKFGVGVIIDAKHKGEHATLSINFGANGIKNLSTQYAKLEVA